MHKRTLLLALALAGGLPHTVRAQDDAARPDTMQGMMSGVVRPTRPATVFMGFGWSYRSGESYRVDKVTEDSPASRAGLMTGDVLLAVDDRDLTQSGILFPNNAPGRHYRLRVQRGDQEIELEIISGPPRPIPPVLVPAP